jgi:hypothetical protein
VQRFAEVLQAKAWQVCFFHKTHNSAHPYT